MALVKFHPIPIQSQNLPSSKTVISNRPEPVGDAESQTPAKEQNTSDPKLPNQCETNKGEETKRESTREWKGE